MIGVHAGEPILGKTYVSDWSGVQPLSAAKVVRSEKCGSSSMKKGRTKSTNVAVINLELSVVCDLEVLNPRIHLVGF